MFEMKNNLVNVRQGCHEKCYRVRQTEVKRDMKVRADRERERERVMFR